MYRFAVVDLSKSGRLPIRAVVARTGLSPDTIRAWERRYQAVSPVRSEGGTRQFSEEDVTRLLCLKELRDRGFGMQTIAGLSTSELTSMRGGGRGGFERVRATQPPLSPSQHAYLDKIESLDANGAQAALHAMGAGVGNLQLILGVAIPIMWEVGRRWSEGTLGTAPEHLVRAQLRQLMTSRLEQIPDSEGARRLLFTTPAGQLHEFGILAGSVLAKEAGFDVLYLGPDLPIEDIIWSVAKSRADILVLSVVRHMDEDQMRKMERLVDTVAPSVPVWIGCPPDHPLIARTPKATFISSIEDFQLAASSLLDDSQRSQAG
jgi:DNA-binding transcriptional MerR regulator